MPPAGNAKLADVTSPHPSSDFLSIFLTILFSCQLNVEVAVHPRFRDHDDMESADPVSKFILRVGKYTPEKNLPFL